MNARTLLTTTTFAALMTAALPAKAADPQLLNLVMPEAKVLAGVNVDQAKTSPFGQYVLGLIQSSQDKDLQQLVAETGFDPTHDVHEVLMASTTVSQSHATATAKDGLLLALGTFDPARITAAATQHGAKTTTYGGVPLLTDPKGEAAVAFLSSTIAAAGDVASVKGAIDRHTTPPTAPLPAALTVQVNQWSYSQDAWVVSLIPTSSLTVPKGAPGLPGVGTQGTTAFQSIQQAAGGVKFGANVVVTAQAQADTAQNAQQMGEALKLLASLAQMQSQNNAGLKTLLTSLTITPQGNLLNVSFTIPQDQIQEIVKPHARAPRHLERKM